MVNIAYHQREVLWRCLFRATRFHTMVLAICMVVSFMVLPEMRGAVLLQ